VICTDPFDPVRCGGYTLVAGSNGMEKCCVQNVYALIQPGADKIHKVFCTLQWVAVLAMKWTLEMNPLMSGDSGGQFVKGSTMDVLDAVIFGAYTMNDKILYPKYGISYAPNKGMPQHTDSTMYWAVYGMWLLAFTLATLSPVLYTALRSKNVRSGQGPRDYAVACKDLMTELRSLHHKECHKLVDEALTHQLDQYMHDAQARHDQPVSVYSGKGNDEDDHVLEGLLTTGGVRSLILDEEVDVKKGKATHDRGANYRVTYKDGSSEKVSVERIRPAFEESHHAFGHGCFQGWCAVGKCAASDFDNYAEVLDAWRSLFFLELPFLLGRWYFEGANLTLESFTIILMAKNLVWAVHDFLVIVTCNNPAATIFGHAPLPALSTMINGSAMSSVFVGPAGFFRIAADVTMSFMKGGYEEQIANANLHRAWLLVERQRYFKTHRHSADTDAVEKYNQAVEAVEREIANLELEAGMVHA